MKSESCSPEKCLGLVRHLVKLSKLLHHIETKSMSDFPSLCGTNQHWPDRSVVCVDPSEGMMLSAGEFESNVDRVASRADGLTLRGRPRHLG